MALCQAYAAERGARVFVPRLPRIYVQFIRLRKLHLTTLLMWNGSLLQYSFLENPIEREAWRVYSPWGHKEWDMTE